MENRRDNFVHIGVAIVVHTDSKGVPRAVSDAAASVARANGLLKRIPRHEYREDCRSGFLA